MPGRTLWVPLSILFAYVLLVIVWLAFDDGHWEDAVYFLIVALPLAALALWWSRRTPGRRS
jgi:membrane protein DedA with SNARE-associated domain